MLTRLGPRNANVAVPVPAIVPLFVTAPYTSRVYPPFPIVNVAPLSTVTDPNNLPVKGLDNSVAVVVPVFTFRGALKLEPFLKFNEVVP